MRHLYEAVYGDEGCLRSSMLGEDDPLAIGTGSIWLVTGVLLRAIDAVVCITRSWSS